MTENNFIFTYTFLLNWTTISRWSNFFLARLLSMCVCAYAAGFLQTFTLKYNKTLKWINLYLKRVLRGTA